MRMNAVLSNPKHPEYGQFTVPLPIPHNQYNRIMEALNAMDMGDPLARDCQMDEILGEYPILKRLEGKPVNIDELDYLAKRLDSFCYAQEGAQFQGAAVSYDYSDMTDLINLTFSCQQVTVITDFSDLEQVGRDHYMVLNGGCASKEELDALDGYETALLLIDEGNGVITPYGVVYDNGMRLSQLYDGRHFPQYFYEPPLLTLTVQQSKDAPKTWLYLPAPDLHIKRSLVRAGIVDPADMRLSFQGSEFPDAVDCVLDMESECLEELNKLCQAIQQLSTDEIKKLGAVVEYARPETAAQVRQLAENLEQFDYAPGVQNVEEYGRYMIQKSGRFEYDENLRDYYDYARYGLERMNEGVRITVVRASDHAVVTTPFDLTNKQPAAGIYHFGKVSKIQYNGGAALSPVQGGYSYKNPAQPIPRIISTNGNNNIEAIKRYFCSEYAVKLIAEQTGMDYETLIGGEYKILLEPIAYYKYEGVMIATTATEAAMYDEVVSGHLRTWMGSLTHKNLPLSMFLETADLGYPAWSGSTTQHATNSAIKSSLGLGIVRFEEQPEEPTITTYDYEYRTNTEVITAVEVSGGQSDPDNPVTVRFNILGTAYTVSNVYYPDGDSQLAWVRWTTPDTPQDVTITVSVSGPGSAQGTIQCKIVDLDENPPPNPVADDRNDSFSPSAVPSRAEKTSAQWSIGNTTAVLDELYVWLSDNITVGTTIIEYIRNILKRVRKKESNLIMASQNLEDFDREGIRELTKPLFAIPPHQFIFNCGSIDKRFYMDLLQLEEAEYNLIRFPQRGVCLFKCGNERYLLEVHAPAYKEALYGSAGGR